ncbi:MAG: type IX secretion system membrane protein PorP/SprF [Flavobacteriaceae bacterium]
MNVEKNKASIIGVLLLIISCNSLVYAQQDSQFTQYMYNTISFNPAYAGTRNVVSFNILHRSQWIGVEGAPTTQTFSLNSPVGKNIGLGLSFYNDKIGPSSETIFSIDFSYQLQVSDESTFSFGLKGGVNNFNVDFNRLNIQDPTDLSFRNNISQLSPIIGVGGYLYTDKWYVGISSPNLLSTKHYDDSSISKAVEVKNFYAIAGYVFELSDQIKLKPATLLKVVEGAPVALDISANVLYNEKLTIGAGYRFQSSISVLVALKVSDKMQFGVAYDYDASNIGNYNSGSYELFLRYDFLSKIKGKVSPRFF